jgi:hypothetical protein
MTVAADGVIYSAGHVLTDDRSRPVGSPVFMPSPLDSPNPKLLGYLQGWYLDVDHDVGVASAVAPVKELTVKGYGKVLLGGSAEDGDAFFQSGRSGEGDGVILAANALAKVAGFPWGDCIFEGYLTTPLGVLGDSGAPLVRDGRLFAYVVGTGPDFQVALPFDREVRALYGR